MNARHQLQLKLAPWALLAVAAAWGAAFVVMKPAIERQSVRTRNRIIHLLRIRI